MSDIQIKVLDRSDKVLVSFSAPIDTTVSEFKKLYNQQIKLQGKTPLHESRLYFTVGTAKGNGLKDKTKTLADYLAD